MFKVNKLIALLRLNLFLYVSCTGLVYGAECGVLRFMENKSNGVQVLSNSCGSNTDIAIGSQLNLTPGARLWVKTPLHSGAGKHFQAICQNRSSAQIAVSVSSADSPWLSAEGLQNCSAWIDNKMSCDGSRGEPQALYCVIAEIVAMAPQTQAAAERTTSVTMREIKLSKPTSNAAPFDKTQIIAALQPEADLCRSLYQPSNSLRVDWIIDAEGNIVSAIPISQGGRRIIDDANRRYADCVLAVIKDYPYPKPLQIMMISADF